MLGSDAAETERLRRVLRELESLVALTAADSDSAFVLAIAHDTLGARAWA